MIASTENIDALVNSTACLTEKKNLWRENSKAFCKRIKILWRETTVEPCLFVYMICIYLSALAVQNMHLEKACRVNYHFGDEICDRIRDRINTTGLEYEVNKVQKLVANMVAWKMPLQTAVPAIAVLFVGAWSDKYKKRKICILFPMLGEIISNIGLLLATYFFYELSLTETALIETLPAAFTGGYIIIFMGVYSFITDRTAVEDRTFRLGIIAICVNIGTPVGTVLSGILLNALGYYGMFSLILALHSLAFIYGVLKLEDVSPPTESMSQNINETVSFWKNLKELLGFVVQTVSVAFKPRLYCGRMLILCVLALYIIMVGPYYGDSQVGYLYAINKFKFTTVEYSVYGTVNILVGMCGTVFCISVMSKRLHVEDSVIGGLASVSRIAASFVFAFAPNRLWYYTTPLFNVFSQTALTCIRSIASKSVPPEEVAKISSLIGAMEGIASMMYSPISSAIYTSTIDTFPGAFYMFDAGLTVLALGIFMFIYCLGRARREIAKTENNSKESYARTNVECFD